MAGMDAQLRVLEEKEGGETGGFTVSEGECDGFWFPSTCDVNRF